MHAAYFRTGGVAYDLPLNLLSDISIFARQFGDRLNELEELLTHNRIWRQRLRGIALVSALETKAWALSGVFTRAAGLNFDKRRDESYEVYSAVKFNIPLGQLGDCYDRYIIRIEEMRQSLAIIVQVLDLMPAGLVRADNFNLVAQSRKSLKLSMEAVIRHFKAAVSGFFIAANEAYTSIETPKGEFGVFLVSKNSPTPYRVKIRPSGIANLQGLDFMSKNHFLADVVTTVGTQDVVFGEIDR
jgi:NADH dehydrogenase (ubiquinone) Fe-S protein 2